MGTAESNLERRADDHDRFRSVAQLDMLHSLAARLNGLRDVQEIGAAITAELRTIIDYHSCRVYLLRPDERILQPIAFRGEMFSEYESETYEELVSEMGEGITGTVAATRTSLLTPDAREVPFAVLIPGTDDDILESMLAVPMVAGEKLVGVIVLSSLGYGMFDDEDQRLLEVLASHAAVAFDNAGLLQAERAAAAGSAALLELSKALTSRHTVGDILQEAVEAIPHLVSCRAVGAYVLDAGTGDFRLARLHAVPGVALRPRASIGDVPSDVASAFLFSETEPFVLDQALVEQVPQELHFVVPAANTLVVPLNWEPNGFGALVAVADPDSGPFGDDELRSARGIGDITSLALGTARRLSELERFHELVESLDATFWEASAVDLTFTFVGGRSNALLGADASTWQGRTWGEHVLDLDRDEVVAAIRAAVRGAGDASLEYRVRALSGDVMWIRDQIHVVRGAQGPRQLRGLMVDITERKLAEQALRESERQASEAFRREREAAQRLRALDDMKNTFLEAVSHDLRTPLTSILGSALTLDQTKLDMPRDDAIDLVRRIATNARKLERLLGDLLDLDRLQRGIVSPQRRPADLAQLVSRAVEETENPQDRPIEIDVTPLVVSIDGAKVERILENLVSNALRHTPTDTRVWVRAEGRDGGVLLTVEDDGAGIPLDLREAVFEPFRQAPGSSSEHSPGVGVGLSLVKRFAELHGGRAWVEDRQGGGSSFKVFLPGG